MSIFAPGDWVDVAYTFYNAYPWVNWVIFIVGLLFTVYVLAMNDRAPKFIESFVGVVMSVVIALTWPILVGGIPILLYVALIGCIVCIPMWIANGIRLYKAEKKAKRALATHALLDKS